jgi:hypothetical protein
MYLDGLTYYNKADKAVNNRKVRFIYICGLISQFPNWQEYGTAAVKANLLC